MEFTHAQDNLLNGLKISLLKEQVLRLRAVCKKVIAIGTILADDTPEKPSVVYGHPTNEEWAEIFLAAKHALKSIE